MVEHDEQGATTAADPAPSTTPAPAPKDRHRGRSIAATVLGILTVLVLVVAVVAVWARATVLRREPIANLVVNALDEPEVQTALAQRITDAVVEAVDLQSQLVSILPDQLDRFAPSIAAGAASAVERALANALDRPDVQNGVRTLVEKAHDVAMKLLQGDGLLDGVAVVDGAVTLNLLPLVNRGLGIIQGLGILSNVTLPTMDISGDPAQQQQQLEQALGRDLPDGFGQVVVYQSESLANAQANLQTAQEMLVIAKRAVWLAVILSVVLAAATILVAARRWRATLILGIGVAGAMVVLRSAIRQIVATAPDVAEKAGAKAAIRVIVGGAAESLLRLAGVILLVGLVAAAVAVMRRRQWRPDLVLVAAVAIGVAIPAFAGLTIWSALIGLVIGIAVPYVARWLLPAGGGGTDPAPDAAGPATTPPSSAATDDPSTAPSTATTPAPATA